MNLSLRTFGTGESRLMLAAAAAAGTTYYFTNIKIAAAVTAIAATYYLLFYRKGRGIPGTSSAEDQLENIDQRINEHLDENLYRGIPFWNEHHNGKSTLTDETVRTDYQMEPTGNGGYEKVYYRGVVGEVQRDGQLDKQWIVYNCKDDTDVRFQEDISSADGKHPALEDPLHGVIDKRRKKKPRDETVTREEKVKEIREEVGQG